MNKFFQQLIEIGATLKYDVGHYVLKTRNLCLRS